MKNKTNILRSSSYDEWYGPIYICPCCKEEMLMNNFNFCPTCGSDLNSYRFESIKEEEEREREKVMMEKGLYITVREV